MAIFYDGIDVVDKCIMVVLVGEEDYIQLFKITKMIGHNKNLDFLHASGVQDMFNCDTARCVGSDIGVLVWHASVKRIWSHGLC